MEVAPCNALLTLVSALLVVSLGPMTTRLSNSLETAPKVRSEWVDHAKGICIFFVVMLHVNDSVQERLQTIGWLDHVVTFARPFRMPDFFLIAGLFLASSLRRPWREYLDQKVVHFLYLYALWMTMQFAVLELPHLLARDDASAGGIALAYLVRYLEPVGPLWFIHILPIFFLITRLTRSVPAPWVWLGAALLHCAQIDTGYHVPDELGARFVYFYSGYVLAPHVFRIAASAHARTRLSLAYLACWGLINGLVVAAGLATLPVISLALGYAGALAVIVTAVLLSKLQWARPLRYLGKHSMVVYLGELGVSMIVIRLLLPWGGDVGVLALVASLVTIVGTIALWRLIIRTPGRFMYERRASHWLAMLFAFQRRPRGSRVAPHRWWSL